MKKTVLNLMMLLFMLSINTLTFSKNKLSTAKSQRDTIYFGQFQGLPETKFYIFYDGEQIKLCDQSFSIKDQSLKNINLLFVDPEKINFDTEDNTVLNVKIETKNYKFYSLQATRSLIGSENKTGYTISWKIVEKTIDSDHKIPLNTIIVPLNPENINIHLQNVTGKASDLVTKLPIIKLTGKDQKTLKDLVLESNLKVIRLKPFYAKQQIKCATQNSMKIALII